MTLEKQADSHLWERYLNTRTVPLRPRKQIIVDDGAEEVLSGLMTRFEDLDDKTFTEEIICPETGDILVPVKDLEKLSKAARVFLELDDRHIRYRNARVNYCSETKRVTVQVRGLRVRYKVHPSLGDYSAFTQKLDGESWLTQGRLDSGRVNDIDILVSMLYEIGSN